METVQGRERLFHRLFHLLLFRPRPAVPSFLFGEAHQAFDVFLAVADGQLAILEGEDRVVERNVGIVEAVPYQGVVARYDRAVVGVGLRTVVFGLIDHVREKDPVDFFPAEVMDMRMHQFGREADIVAHHFPEVLLVGLVGGYIAQDQFDVELREQGRPEREVGIEIQYPRHAQAQEGLRQRCLLEDPLAAVGVDVVAFGFLRPETEYLFAFVPGKVTFPVGELVDVNQAVVFAAFANRLRKLVFDFAFDVDRMGFEIIVFQVFQGVQGAAVSPHQLRAAVAEYLVTHHVFQSLDHRVVAHGSPLHHDMFANLGIPDFEYLVEAVLDHRVG